MEISTTILDIFFEISLFFFLVCYFFSIFALVMMNRLRHALVWLSRIHCCRGFGIQSPTDYAFVRYVINEHWPYYAYERLGRDDGFIQRKLGLLYFRLVNWRQPAVMIDRVGARPYLHEGCHQAAFADVDYAGPVEIAFLSIHEDVVKLFSHCDERSVVVVQDINHDKTKWKQLLMDNRVTISYDLYYCGILMFDPKRYPHHYIINF